jgi:hypothetical protein
MFTLCRRHPMARRNELSVPVYAMTRLPNLRRGFAENGRFIRLHIYT